MPQSVSEIIENIKLLSVKGSEVVRFETEKLVKLLQEDLDKLVTISNGYTRKIEEQTAIWDRINKEVKELEGRRDDLKVREARVDKKIAETNDREDTLVKLHEALERKRKTLDAKEKELLDKEKTSNEKVAKPL